MRKLLMIICTAISCMTFAQGIITSSASSEVYNGVLLKSISYGSNNSTTIEGLITVTARWKTEKIAASVAIDGKKYAFSKPEKLSDYSYKFIYKIKKSTESLILTLNFSGNDISGSLQGPITGGADFDVAGSRNRFKDKKSLEYSLATSLQGQYNATLNDTFDRSVTDGNIALLHNGYGSYFTVKVSKNGSAKVSVFLSDGTKVSANSQLTFLKRPFASTANDLIGVPFDIPLYSKKGSISGIFFINSEDKTISSRKSIRASLYSRRYYSDIKWHRTSTTGSASILFDVKGRIWDMKDVADKHTFNLDGYFPTYFNKGIEYSVISESLPNGITASYNGKNMAVEKTASKFRLSVAKATGIISGSFTAFYPSGDPKKKSRSVTAKIFGVMINDSTGASAKGFISIPEANPIQKKINKVRIVQFHTATPESRYIVVDLSAGDAATTYPISYLADVPFVGWTDEYKTDKIVFRKIPAGAFWMGSPTSETGRYGSEVQHHVTLTKSFYMGIFEVTQKQYELVTGNKPSYFTGDTLPVEQVSWDMIKDGNIGFMNVLSKKVAGLNFDLPTEAQWEYACRAGTTGSCNVDGKTLSDLGWFGDNSSSKTHAVGEKLSNDWGLYDMHGNVFEWCLDWFGNYSDGDVTDPTGPGSGDDRVIRGGGWDDGARICRSACRLGGFSSYAYADFGFRPVAFSGL